MPAWMRCASNSRLHLRRTRHSRSITRKASNRIHTWQSVLRSTGQPDLVPSVHHTGIVASATLKAGKEAVRANGELRPPRSRGLPCSARAATQRSAMPMETMTWINWRSTTRIGNYQAASVGLRWEILNSAARSGLKWEVEGMGRVRTSLSIGNTSVS